MAKLTKVKNADNFFPKYRNQSVSILATLVLTLTNSILKKRTF